MKNRDHTPTVLASALSMLFAVTASGAESLHHPEKPTYKYEKCYGVAKAGQNDCFTSTNACGGTTQTDSQPNAWIYQPAGSCLKITGGSLEPKES